LEPLPEPGREHLARRVLEALDFVQVVVIQQLEEGLPGLVDHRVIDEPARAGVRLALDGEVDLEAVAVQARTFVARGHLGQAVGGFEVQVADESDFHGIFLGVRATEGWRLGSTPIPSPSPAGARRPSLVLPAPHSNSRRQRTSPPTLPRELAPMSFTLS